MTNKQLYDKAAEAVDAVENYLQFEYSFDRYIGSCGLSVVFSELRRLCHERLGANVALESGER